MFTLAHGARFCRPSRAVSDDDPFLLPAHAEWEKPNVKVAQVPGSARLLSPCCCLASNSHSVHSQIQYVLYFTPEVEELMEIAGLPAQMTALSLAVIKNCKNLCKSEHGVQSHFQGQKIADTLQNNCSNSLSVIVISATSNLYISHMALGMSLSAHWSTMLVQTEIFQLLQYLINCHEILYRCPFSAEIESFSLL